MVEIKFLKELPVRSLNKSSLIQLNGADIYVDKDANRFAFFGFKNIMRSPLFSLYLVIKQYDSFGSFIKETKFSLPSIYVPRGSFVIEKPVRISDECEGCEVYVAYAEFTTKQFYQDKLVSKSYLSDFTEDYFAGAPKTVSCSINSNINIIKEAPATKVASSEVESKPVAKEETPKAVVEEKFNFEEAKVENKSEEVTSETIEISSDEVSVKHYRRRFSYVNLIILGASTVVFIVLALILYFIF